MKAIVQNQNSEEADILKSLIKSVWESRIVPILIPRMTLGRISSGISSNEEVDNSAKLIS